MIEMEQFKYTHTHVSLCAWFLDMELLTCYFPKLFMKIVWNRKLFLTLINLIIIVMMMMIQCEIEIKQLMLRWFLEVNSYSHMVWCLWKITQPLIIHITAELNTHTHSSAHFSFTRSVHVSCVCVLSSSFPCYTSFPDFFTHEKIALMLDINHEIYECIFRWGKQNCRKKNE